MEDLLARCAAAGIAVAPQSDAAVHAGAATLRSGSATDEVDAHEVTLAAQLVGADVAETRVLLVPRLGRFARPHRGADAWHTPLPPWGMRLARLVRAVRRALGDDDLDLRWADDGRQCRLVAVTRP
ncbi:MAG: hypothetical protein ABIO67_06075 [Mycobacteriales bacterium]